MTNVTHPDPTIGFNAPPDTARVLKENLELLDFALKALVNEHCFLPLGFMSELLNTIKAKAHDPNEAGGCCGTGGAYCNASFGNIAISSDAKIYPCHMFTANSAFEMEIADGQVLRAPRMASKADHAECGSCWASKWCVACPGAMEFRRPGQTGPSPIHCGLMRGGLKHTFDALLGQSIFN